MGLYNLKITTEIAMSAFAGTYQKLIILLVFAILLAIPCTSLAQDESPDAPVVIADILHPPLDQPVAPLDTLILIQIDDYYVGADYFYLILLDDQPVTARWDSDTLSFSYYPDHMLTTGEHTIEVYMTIIGGPENQLVANGTFTVAMGGATTAPLSSQGIFDLGTIPSTPPPPTSVSRYSTDFFNLSGRASIDAGFVNMSGLGSSLRQEPSNTSIFNLNGNGRTGITNFNFRFYLTTDETQHQQPRNRYYADVSTDTYGLAVGDTTTRLGSLVLDGLRVRGASAWGSLGIFSLSLVEGEVHRETHSMYNADGTLIQRGTGAQRLWATRLGLFEDGPFSLGATLLEGEEDPADTPGFGNPGSNTVRSLDAKWEFDGGNGAIRGAWASADYNYDDPARTDVSGETAMEFEAAYNTSGHRFKVKWQVIDPGFRSIGRLSLQPDRETWRIEDRFNLWRGGLTGQVYYEKYNNNLDSTLTYTTTTARYGGQINYRFGLRGLTATVGYDTQNRTNDATAGGAGWVDENTNTLTLGLRQSFNLADARHDIRINWRNLERDNTANPVVDSTQEVLTISLVSRWNRGFSMDLQYGTTDNKYTGRSTFTNADRFSVRFGYDSPARDYNIWGRWESVDANGNLATFNSNRETIEFGAKMMLSGSWSLETKISMVNFDDRINNANDFEENTFRIILVQIF